MNKLALSALLIGGLLQSSGCIISSSSDTDEGAYLNVSWDVTPGCPAGGAAMVTAKEKTSGKELTNIFNCSAGAGVTTAMDLGNYDVWVDIRSQDLTQLFAQSLSIIVDANVDGATVAATLPSFPLDDGFFSLTWNLTQTGGGAITCAQAGSGGMRIGATLAGTSSAEFNIFNCEDGAGTTNPIPLGLHTIVVDVMDMANNSIESSEASEETLTYGNELIDLGNFEFKFTL